LYPISYATLCQYLDPEINESVTSVRRLSPSADVTPSALCRRVVDRWQAQWLKVGAEFERTVDSQQRNVVMHRVGRELGVYDHVTHRAHLSIDVVGHTPTVTTHDGPLVLGGQTAHRQEHQLLDKCKNVNVRRRLV